MSKILKILLLAGAYILPFPYGKAQTVKVGGHTFRGAATNLASAQGTDKIPTATAVYNYANGYLGAKVIFGTPTNGQVPIFSTANNRWEFGATGGSGTVTSFSAGALSPLFTTSVSTATTTPALSFSLSNAAAFTVLGRATGTGAPSYLTLESGHIPNLDAAKITTGIFGVARGGTGLSAFGTGGQFLRVNSGATALEYSSLVAADIPNLDASKLTSGTLGIARGGTGLSALGTANQLLRVNAGATALEYFTPSYLTANQAITLSGDVTGSGATGISTTIANNAVTTAKIADANVTTAKLADAGVTMAKLAQAGATSGQIIKWNGTAWAPANDETAAGGGGVSSVGLSLPALFSVTGSPVTSSGTLTAAFASQTANTFLAAPNGSGGVPTMRAIVAADVPSLPASIIGSGTFSTAFLADGAVTTAKIADANVTTAKLADAGVTMAKLAQAGATSGQIIKWNGSAWAPAADASNSGTVTSVALSLPDIFSVSGSPVTSSGTLTATLASQSAKQVFMSPNLSSGTPSFRDFVPSDINQAGATAGQVIKWNGTNWAPAADATGSGATNLTATHGTTTVTIESDTGTDAVINGASDTQAGVITTGAQTFAGDKLFLGGLTLGGQMQTAGNTFFLVGDAQRIYRGAGSAGGSAVNQMDFYNSGLSTALARFRLQNGDSQPRFITQVGGTDVMTAHSTGIGIGIGSATPARALEVAGAIPIRTPGMTSGSTNMTGTLKMMVVNSSGDVGVGDIPSGGGGGTTSNRVVTTVVANSSGTTLVNTGLSFSIESGKNYRFTAYIRYSTSATGNGIRLAIDAPSNWAATANIQSTASVGFTANLIGGGVAIGPNAPDLTGNIGSITGEIFATSAGTLNIQFGSELSTGSVAVQPDSQLFITKLN